MKKQQFHVLAEAWKEPDRLKRMRYTITHLVFLEEICLAEIDGAIVKAKSSEGKSVIPVWPSCADLEATFARTRPEVNARKYSRKDFEEEILNGMKDNELIAVFPDKHLHYEQFDKDEMIEAIRFVQDMSG